MNRDPEYPAVVFVYQGTVEQGPMFFERLFSDAVAIADPDGDLYREFEVERGGLKEMFGPQAWVCGLRATRQGHRIGRKVGDPWTLPTVFAIDRGNIVGEFRGEHAGDHPDLDELAAMIRGSYDH